MASKSKPITADKFADVVVRAFDRELKANGKKFSTGGMVGSYECALDGDEFGFVLVVLGVSHKDASFERAGDVYVMIRASKPEARHGKLKEVVAAKRMLGVKVFRSVNPGAIEERAVLAFCRQHAKRIKELKLHGPEDIGITSSSIRFRWKGTDPVVLRPRLQAFAGLIQGMTGTPKADPLLFQREWRLKRVPKHIKSKTQVSTAAHYLGGKLTHAVACPVCNEATNLIAQLDFSDPALPKTAMGRIKLPVLSCLACLDWGPAFYDVSGDLPRPLDSKGRILKQNKLIESDDELDRRPFMVSLAAKSKKAARTSKLGGVPHWIQGNGTPTCPKCRDAMTFVMQLQGDSQVEFGDVGLLYTFVCPKCKIAASLIQSH